MVGAVDPKFWKGRRVLLTGQTGFKGAWCALWLHTLGARVTGFALPPDDGPNMFRDAHLDELIDSRLGDLRDRAAVEQVMAQADPQIVLHLGAQAIVRRALREPIETIGTNVLGTAHVLEAARAAPSLQAILCVTTDKVYANGGQDRAFQEGDALGGVEPYGASKAAAEMVVQSYAHSFFQDRGVAVAAVRGGNVIGGGDYSEDRLVPDIARAVMRGETVTLRYPDATRPWQHVLDCLGGYLVYAQALTGKRHELPEALNIGPEPGARVTVRAITEALLDAFGSGKGWRLQEGPAPPEAHTLALDTSLARRALGWRDRYPGAAALDMTVDWYSAVAAGASPRTVTQNQIERYMDQPAARRPSRHFA